VTMTIDIPKATCPICGGPLSCYEWDADDDGLHLQYKCKNDCGVWEMWLDLEVKGVDDE